jgi:hypothetical protein
LRSSVEKKTLWTLGKKGLEGVDWIHLAQNRNRWWALVNTVMNFVSIKDENILTS